MRPKRAVALAVAATAVVTVAGCTADKTTTPVATPPDAHQIVSSTPPGTKPVDKVTWDLVDGEPGTIDPRSASTFINPNLCESLFRLTPDFGVEPGIATDASWTGANTFVINLRSDVRFWDGTSVTPDDVVYSLERNEDPSSNYYGSYAFVTGIEATGAHQVTVHFSQPNAIFESSLSSGGGVVMEKAFGDKVGDALGTASGGLMCTGPFELGTWTPGSRS